MNARRTHALGWALCLVACGAACSALGADAGVATGLDDRALRALLNPADANALVGLQVAVVVDGVVTERAYGRRFVHPTDRAQDLPLEVGSLVRAASASKPITAIAVLQQVEHGRLALDADVSKYLGFRLRNPRFPDVPITLRQLLSHTSSIVDGPGYRFEIGERLQDFLAPGPRWDDGARFSAHAPGSFFEYSNLGWGVLGTALERVTHTRFDRLVAHEVIARAGIEGSFDVTAIDPARLAVRYRKGPEDAAAWDAAGPWLAQMDDPRPLAAGGSGKWNAPGADPGIAAYQPGDNGTLFSPQGGFRTSAGQMARLWSCLLIGEEHGGSARSACPGRALLRARTRAAMFTPRWTDDPLADDGDTWSGGFRSWGLGVQLFTGTHDSPTAGAAVRASGDSPSALLDGRPLVGHLAEAYGLFGGVWFTPDGRYGVVYFATGSAQPFSANHGERSSLYRWEEQIVDWAAREAWREAPARD